MVTTAFASLDGRFRLNNNWLTQMQRSLQPKANQSMAAEKTTGYQRNIQVNRVGRTVQNHTHYITTSKDFRTELGFKIVSSKRTPMVSISGSHLIFPERTALNSQNTTIFGVYLEDIEGTSFSLS